MNLGVFSRAYERMMRAWKEAEYLLNCRSPREQAKLSKLQSKKAVACTDLVALFDQLEQSACASCQRCCSKAAMDSGYFSHAERQALLIKGVDIKQYIVTAWPLTQKEPEERCLFLSHDGCNIPAEHRSVQCLSYVCQDRLGPQLVQLDLAKSFTKAKSKLTKVGGKMKAMPEIALSEFVPDLGDG